MTQLGMATQNVVYVVNGYCYPAIKRQERKRKEVKILQKWQMINPSKSYTSPLKISSLFKIKEKEIYKSRLVEVG